MAGTVFGLGSDKGEYRVMCLDVNSRLLADVSAKVPKDFKEAVYAPTDKHKRLVCCRGVRGERDLAVLTFP